MGIPKAALLHQRTQQVLKAARLLPATEGCFFFARVEALCVQVVHKSP